MESCNSWLCQLLFSGSCYDGRWVLFAQMVWIATRRPWRLFLSFLQDSLSVPLWLLKKQDISVPAGALGVAEPGFRVLAALNELSPVAPAGQCSSRVWRFTHTDTVPHCALAGWLWGRQGGHAKQWQLLSICRQQLHFSCAQRRWSLQHGFKNYACKLSFHRCCFTFHLLLSSEQAAPC